MSLTYGGKDSPAFILRNKRDISRLQVLVEIVEHQPAVRQQEIGRTLGLTPQAISDYIRDLAERGLVMANGRGSYEVTHTGIEWMLEKAKALDAYSHHIRHDLIHEVSVWTAIADEDLFAGENAGIFMRDGFLCAARKSASATGRVMADARAGFDVGISNLNGIIEHHTGVIHICKIPGIKNAGSRNVRRDALKKITEKTKMVGAVGLESWVALNSIGRKPDLYFAALAGVIDAARYGIDCTIVVVDDQFTDILWHVANAKVDYVIHDLTIPGNPGTPPPATG